MSQESRLPADNFSNRTSAGSHEQKEPSTIGSRFHSKFPIFGCVFSFLRFSLHGTCPGGQLAHLYLHVFERKYLLAARFPGFLSSPVAQNRAGYATAPTRRIMVSVSNQDSV
jgi:hypothetical protein